MALVKTTNVTFISIKRECFGLSCPHYGWQGSSSGLQNSVADWHLRVVCFPLLIENALNISVFLIKPIVLQKVMEPLGSAPGKRMTAFENVQTFNYYQQMVGIAQTCLETLLTILMNHRVLK